MCFFKAEKQNKSRSATPAAEEEEEEIDMEEERSVDEEEMEDGQYDSERWIINCFGRNCYSADTLQVGKGRRGGIAVQDEHNGGGSTWQSR